MNRLEQLVATAYQDPRKIREVVEAAFRLGGGTPLDRDVRQAVAEKLRRRARVLSEHDGKSHLIELAKELEGMVGA